VIDSDKLSSLLRYGINYDRKTFCNEGPREEREKNDDKHPRFQKIFFKQETLHYGNRQHLRIVVFLTIGVLLCPILKHRIERLPKYVNFVNLPRQYLI
jgi:hypothetical protein